MKYTYNQERDRLKVKAWDPYYFKVTYEDIHTKEERGLFLHACTDHKGQIQTVAENYMNETEIIKSICGVPKRTYEKWLCGTDEIEINNELIPASYITLYLVADDSPTSEIRKGKYGDLSKVRQLLLERDVNLLQDIFKSWNLSKEENDIVRESFIEEEK